MFLTIIYSLPRKIALSHRMGSVNRISDEYEKGMNRKLNFLHDMGR
jgi:hypothetical protein